MKLVSQNLGGNIHSAVEFINKLNLAEAVIHMESSGHNSIVVFRFADDFDYEKHIDDDFKKRRAKTKP